MAVEEPEQEPMSPQDSRLTSLEERLKRAEEAEARRTGRASAESQRAVRVAGARILQDLIGLPFGGAVVGYLFDRWLETAPWIMLAMMFLGFGIAVRNVMQASKSAGDKSGK